MDEKISEQYFVEKDSIVREIWGKGDTILFIFAGASAEFALNKAVDWLYFTGRLPKDPLGRLFSTVSYARTIVFAEKEAAFRAIDSIASIHSAVEENRGAKIPDWAYRDVLFMLIDYSMRSFEVLERKLTQTEKEEVFDVFNRVGERMGVEGLPETFLVWEQMRKDHLKSDTMYSDLTKDLYRQYRKHLGAGRFQLLKEAQRLIAPSRVRELLDYRRPSILAPLLKVYKGAKNLKMEWLLKALILPSDYKKEIRSLDQM